MDQFPVEPAPLGLRLVSTLRTLGIDAAQCQPLGAGWINAVYEVIWRGRRAALRLNDARRAGAGTNRAIEREAHLWGAQMQVAPEIFEVGEDFLLAELVEGTHPTQEAARNQQTLRDIVAAVKLVHAGPAVALERSLRDVIRFWVSQLVSLGDVPGPLQWALETLACVDNGAPETLVLSHNDLNPPNIFVNGHRVKFIDWELASMASPFQDLARLAMIAGTEDAEELILSTYFGRATSENRRQLILTMSKVDLLRAVLKHYEGSEDLMFVNVLHFEGRIKRLSS